MSQTHLGLAGSCGFQGLLWVVCLMHLGPTRSYQFLRDHPHLGRAGPSGSWAQSHVPPALYQTPGQKELCLWEPLQLTGLPFLTSPAPHSPPALMARDLQGTDPSTMG